MTGLETLGVLEAMKTHKNTLKPLFLHGDSWLNAELEESLFSYELAEKGSNRFRLEKKTLSHWRDLLIDLEGICILLILNCL